MRAQPAFGPRCSRLFGLHAMQMSQCSTAATTTARASRLTAGARPTECLRMQRCHARPSPAYTCAQSPMGTPVSVTSGGRPRHSGPQSAEHSFHGTDPAPTGRPAPASHWNPGRGRATLERRQPRRASATDSFCRRRGRTHHAQLRGGSGTPRHGRCARTRILPIPRSLRRAGCAVLQRSTHSGAKRQVHAGQAQVRSGTSIGHKTTKQPRRSRTQASPIADLVRDHAGVRCAPWYAASIVSPSPVGFHPCSSLLC